MEYCQTETPTNELEVTQVVWVNARGRVDLKSIVVVC